MNTTTTTIPADWDITDSSTWTLTTTVDAHMGYHHTGMVMRELRTITHRADDIGVDGAPDADAAEWFAAVLTAIHDADVAIAEASPEELARVSELIEARTDSDDYEIEAEHARAITAALASR